MSYYLNSFKICRNISEDFKKQIKYFHVFNDNFSGSNVLFITFDDKVFAFGSNSYGVLGFGHWNEVKEVTEIPELNAMNIKEFYNGLNFVIAVNNQNNVLFGWGKNGLGQLGRGYRSE